jgi:hypothetical protein
MSDILQMSKLENIGAVCIIGLKGENKKYKIEYTKSCQSQVIKTHKTQGQNIEIHLYKYCSRADTAKIRDILKEYQTSNTPPNAHWYVIGLDDLFEKFLEYFEPDMR